MHSNYLAGVSRERFGDLFPKLQSSADEISGALAFDYIDEDKVWISATGADVMLGLIPVIILRDPSDFSSHI